MFHRVVGVHPWLQTPENKYAYRNQLSKLSWVVVGDHSYDNGAKAWRWSSNEKLLIGKFCSIAHDVNFICGPGRHDVSNVTTFPLIDQLFHNNESIQISDRKGSKEYWLNELYKTEGEITVGHDVWICAGASILPGVNIGNGAVILPGSIVAKNVAPYGIVGGQPAELIRYRFSSEIIELLEAIAWWNWGAAVIRERIADFFDIDTFVRKYGNISEPGSISVQVQSSEMSPSKRREL